MRDNNDPRFSASGGNTGMPASGDFVSRNPTTYDPGFSPKGENSVQERAPATDILSVLASVHERLSNVERDNAEMRAEIDAAKKGGDLDFDTAHAVHVLNKHFFHDKPEAEKAAPMVAKFDPYTGDRLQ